MLARQPGQDLPLGRRRRCPGASRSRPAGGRLAQLVGGANPERAAERDHALGPEADEASEGDELRLDLALELLELGEPAGRYELDQAALDAWPDAVQLAHPSGADELFNGARVSRTSSAARRYARTA